MLSKNNNEILVRKNLFLMVFGEQLFQTKLRLAMLGADIDDCTSHLQVTPPLSVSNKPDSERKEIIRSCHELSPLGRCSLKCKKHYAHTSWVYRCFGMQ